MEKPTEKPIEKPTEYIGKIWLASDVFVITIPKAFIKHGQLESGKNYKISIDEVDTHGN